MDKDYKDSYSESGLWDKLAKFAKKAGKELVLNVLKLFFAMKLGKVTTAQVAMIIAALGYFISPIDVIPDVLPGGFVDDAGLLAALIASISGCSDPEVVEAARKKCDEWFKS